MQVFSDVLQLYLPTLNGANRICDDRHAENNLAPLRFSLISQRKRNERSGPMIYDCNDASRPEMINVCWEHFQKYKFNLCTPSPQT